MPELVSHAVAGYILGGRRRFVLSLVLAGAILPDLLTRLPNFVFNYFGLRGAEEFVRPLHAPLPLLLVALLISYFFAEVVRKRVFTSLTIGIITHLSLDILQRRGPDAGFEIVYERGYTWLFPFSNFDFQLGLFGPEDSVLALPVTSLLAFMVWLRRRKSQ